MNKISVKFIFVSFLVIANLIFIRLANAEQLYYPYPIVFVHGINSSDGMWVNVRDNLRQYFRTAQGIGEYKYPSQTSEKNYFIGCDYKGQNNGLIRNIATRQLQQAIKDALSYYPPEIPENERKVIIACHSMGGLVTRSLLTEIPNYKDKIYRVVFIDTPHLGSPYASVLWLLNEIRAGNAEIDSPIKNITYHSYTAFSPLLFAGKEVIENASICAKIFNTQVHIKLLLAPLDFSGPYPRGDAIRDLRTPAFTSYKATYSGFLSNLTVTLYKDYAANDTFLGQNSLAVPVDYKVITGSNHAGYQITLWSVDKLLKFSSPFTFSPLAGESQSLDNAIFNGDGIVTMSSQKTVDGTVRADYQVNGFHVGVADNAINETLQALENQPVIESVRVIPEDWNAITTNWWNSSQWYYLIFKVKDYLLADIEIESLTLDGGDIVPSSFNIGGIKKPYNSLGKRFLEERDCDKEGVEFAKYKDILGDEKSLHLMPGEFFIKTKIPLNAQSLYIKIKNPAAAVASQEEMSNFTDERIFYFVRPKVNAFWTSYHIDLPPLQGDGSGSPQWPLSSSLYFDIQDSPTQNVTANVWLSYWYTPNIVKKFATNYSNIPLTQSGTVTLPDGNTQLTLYSGGYDAQNTFAAWSGETEPGVTLPPSSHEDGWEYYYLKVTTEPLDTNPNDNTIFLLGSGVTSIAADPTFIQPSRRESVTW